MTEEITDQPDGATPLDEVSGLLLTGITTRAELDEVETVNIVNAVEWMERSREVDVFTVGFYRDLHKRMFDQVWAWAGELRSQTGAQTNVGPRAADVPTELGRVAMEFARDWDGRGPDLLPFVARYHHALVWVHPFNNGNGRWSRLACDAIVQRVLNEPPLVWATDTLNRNSEERNEYLAALRLADAGDIEPLLEYLLSLNPDR